MPLTKIGRNQKIEKVLLTMMDPNKEYQEILEDLDMDIAQIQTSIDVQAGNIGDRLQRKIDVQATNICEVGTMLGCGLMCLPCIAAAEGVQSDPTISAWSVVIGFFITIGTWIAAPFWWLCGSNIRTSCCAETVTNEFVDKEFLNKKDQLNLIKSQRFVVANPVIESIYIDEIPTDIYEILPILRIANLSSGQYRLMSKEHYESIKKTMKIYDFRHRENITSNCFKDINMNFDDFIVKKAEEVQDLLT